MKKTIIIIVVILLILIAALVAVPLLFRQNLLDATKTTLNNNLNAKVEFADFKLYLFKNFPKATIELDNILITGAQEFQNDTLLTVKYAKATMSLSSIFKKSGIKIEEITLEAPNLKMIVNESGKANWDLTKQVDSQLNEINKPEKVAEVTDNEFKLQLDKLIIRNASFLYNDKTSKVSTEFNGINIDISGEMYGTETELLSKGKVDDFTLNYNNIKYVSKTSLESNSLLNVDYETMRFSIVENELLVNRLPLELTGSIEIPSDSMFFDLQIQTKDSDFENFLALVPPVYEEFLKNIKTDGTASIAGSVTGLYFEENYPAFSMDVNVGNGNLQYAGLPEKIENIRADIRIKKPQGDLNLTEINIKEAHAEIRNNPVDLTLKLTNLINDLKFDGAFIGKINFNHLKDALPLDSMQVTGIVDANLFVNGNYSAIENEEYDKLKSDGIVLLDNFVYDSPNLSQKIYVPKGQLDFSPKDINLKEFKMRIGQSDFALSGKVSNYLNYLMKDGVLKGNLQLISRRINFNELFRLKIKPPQQQVQQSTQSQSKEKSNTSIDDYEEEVLAFTIPENIDVSFRSNIKNAVFDRVPIAGINGLVTAKNGKLILKGLKMKMLDGDINLTGSYKNSPKNQPYFDFGIDVLNLDIPMAYRSLSGIQRMLPVAGRSEGKLSTTINMKGRLSPEHKIISNSVTGNGQFGTKNMRIVGSPIFNQLKGILKSEKLNNVTIDDFTANFTVIDGNIDLKPFKTKVADQEAIILGTLSAQNILNMRLDFKVKRDAFGPDIQNILSILPGNEKIQIVPAGVLINGPVGDPVVKMDLSETRKTITDATKGELKNSLDQLGKGLRKLFK